MLTCSSLAMREGVDEDLRAGTGITSPFRARGVRVATHFFPLPRLTLSTVEVGNGNGDDEDEVVVSEEMV